MKILWISANKLGYELLREAMTIDSIEGIITLSDNSSTIMYDGIEKKLWYDLNIPVYEINRLNEEKELISQLSPDLIIMCGWRQIIDKELLDIPKRGFIGFHPTLLPIGRGPAPIINSIMEGFKESGLTMFYVSEGLDDGDIIGQEKFVILETDYAIDVYNKIIQAGKKLISKYLPLLIRGKAPRMPQDNTRATIFEKRSLEANKVDFDSENIEKIYRKIKALSKPYKGAYIEKDGKKLIIWKAELQE